MLGLYAIGTFMASKTGMGTSFRPLYLLDLDPLIWGLLASLIVGVLVSLKTTPPPPDLISKLFDAQPQPVTPNPQHA
jgi:hypothetical protein